MGSYDLSHGTVERWAQGPTVGGGRTGIQVPQNRWAELGDNQAEAQDVWTVLPSSPSASPSDHCHIHSSVHQSLSLPLQKLHGGPTKQVPGTTSY